MRNSTSSVNPNLKSLDWIAASVVALCAVLLSVALASRRGFWLDEYITLDAARMSFHDMIRNRLGAGHSPLYFIYARLGFLFGGTERALRLSSALALGATVIFSTGLAGAMGQRRALPALWALCLAHPYWITAGTEYRYMMTVIALTAAAAWAMLAYARAWNWRAGALAAAVLGLLLWVHSSAQFLALGLLGFILWEARVRAGSWSARVAARIWPVLAGLALSLPLLYLTRHHQSDSSERQLPHFTEILKNLVEVVFGKSDIWIRVLTRLKYSDFVILFPSMIMLGVAIWLTRRELLRRGQATAWRLLTALLAGVPLAQGLITTLVRRVTGPARYVSAFSVPATLCLAIAWSAELTPRHRRIFRGILAALILVQAAGAALDLGDLHREAIRWLLSVRQGEKILVSTRHNNEVAFDYLAGAPVKGLLNLCKINTLDKPAMLGRLREVFTPERRGFVFLYHDPDKNVQFRLDDLMQAGFFKDLREFAVSGEVRVYAFIRDAAEQSWLDALPAFRRPWGPAAGDINEYPNTEKVQKPKRKNKGAN